MIKVLSLHICIHLQHCSGNLLGARTVPRQDLRGLAGCVLPNRATGEPCRRARFRV